MKAFTWNTARELGAVLVADDSLTDVEIAKQAGVHKATLERWKKAPEFQARVRDVRTGLKSKALEIALQYGIADVRQRMHSLDEHWKKMQRVIAERAKDPVMEKAAGKMDPPKTLAFSRKSGFGAKLVAFGGETKPSRLVVKPNPENRYSVAADTFRLTLAPRLKRKCFRSARSLGPYQ